MAMIHLLAHALGANECETCTWWDKGQFYAALRCKACRKIHKVYRTTRKRP